MRSIRLRWRLTAWFWLQQVLLNAPPGGVDASIAHALDVVRCQGPACAPAGGAAPVSHVALCRGA
jgi:hypothetical protein